MSESDHDASDLQWPSPQDGQALTIADWQRFFAQICDRDNATKLADLQTAVATVVPPCLALCALCGSAHGYQLQFTVLQFEGPTFAWYVWDAATKQLTDPRPVQRDLDLRVELQRIRQEPIVLRGDANRNRDRMSGMEGRSATMFLVVGPEAEWIECSSPLQGGTYSNSAINRIFRTMLDSNITLVDDPETGSR